MEVYRTPFIVTSRPHGYLSNPIYQVGTVLQVLPFNFAEVKQFIQRWYLQTEIMSRARDDNPYVRSEAQNHAEDLIERIRDNPAIAKMAQNPLLVTMIATVHYCGNALPGRRVELYQRICDLLLGQRQQAKKIKNTLTAEQNKSVLRVLALALMQQKTREFTPSQGQNLIQSELLKVAGDKLNPEQFLKQIQEVSGLLVERELGIYEFAHLSFQEYLAATQVKELQQERLLIDNLTDPWWTETIRLYAAQSDASQIIQICQQESLKVEPTTREQLDLILEQGLESYDAEIAKLAAQVKLSRRLSNFLKIDDEIEIDRSYITGAEYQLFVSEQLNSQQQVIVRPPAIRNLKQPITKHYLTRIYLFSLSALQLRWIYRYSIFHSVSIPQKAEYAIPMASSLALEDISNVKAMLSLISSASLLRSPK